MQLDPGWSVCPKCDTPAGSVAPEPRPHAGGGGRTRRRRARATDATYTVDVGHHGHTAADIPALLDDARSHALLADAELLRIVHGYGSLGSGGTLREAVHRHCRKWRAHSAIRTWVDGGELAWPPPPPFHAAHRGDAANRGVTLVVW